MPLLLRVLILSLILAAPARAQSQPVTIAIFGDSLAIGLGTALQRWAAARPTAEPVIRIARHGQYGTGLTRYDLFDWQARLEEILRSGRPDIAIILVGANDRQPIYLPDYRALPFDSLEWQKLYSDRAGRFARTLTQAGTAVLWVGLPAMAKPDFDRGMRRIAVLQASGSAGPCVDHLSLLPLTLEANGAYTARVLDADGKKRALRTTDGIHFTNYGYDLVVQAVIRRLDDMVIRCPEVPAGNESDKTASLPPKPETQRP